MNRLGKRINIDGTDSLIRQSWPKRPSAADYAEVPDGHYVVCGLGQEELEELIVVDSYYEMVVVYNEYWNCGSAYINWYIGHRPLTPIEGAELPS
jgi:hypothetical protein